MFFLSEMLSVMSGLQAFFKDLDCLISLQWYKEEWDTVGGWKQNWYTEVIVAFSFLSICGGNSKQTDIY